VGEGKKCHRGYAVSAARAKTHTTRALCTLAV
jgi:hypothetical protein